MPKYEEVNNPFIDSNLKPHKLTKDEIDSEDAQVVEVIELNNEISEIFSKHGTSISMAYSTLTAMAYMIEQYLEQESNIPGGIE